MYFFHSFALSVTLTSAVCAISTQQHLVNSILARAPAASNATVNSISYAGTGCPSSSATFFWDSTSSSVDSLATIAYDEMVAYGVAEAVAEQNLTCITTIDIGLDPGWSFSVGNSTKFRGYLSLPPGTSLLVETQYSIGNATTTESLSIAGDAEGTSEDYSEIVLGTTELTSELGGGFLTIGSSLDLSAGADDSTLVTLDTIATTFFFVEG